MTPDTETRKVRHALDRLQIARRYQTLALRMVKEAELELRRALKDAKQLKQKVMQTA